MARHIELVKKKDLSPFRKIAIGTWQTAYDPSIYGTLRLRMDQALRYIEDFRRATGRRITVTHLVVKAVAAAFRACPDANALIRWNRIYLRKHVDLSLTVLIAEPGDTGKIDLTVAKIERADELSLVEIHDKLQAHIERVRARQDAAIENTRQRMKLVPYSFMNFFLKFLSFLMYTLNIDMRWAGLPRDPFGTALITNIGSIGLDLAYVPLVPYTRISTVVTPGAVRDEPVVEDGKIVVGKVMDISATFDHRLIDGAHAAILARTVRSMFADPYGSFDKLEGVGAPAA